jgi:hypothetical protein
MVFNPRNKLWSQTLFPEKNPYTLNSFDEINNDCPSKIHLGISKPEEVYDFDKQVFIPPPINNTIILGILIEAKALFLSNRMRWCDPSDAISHINPTEGYLALRAFCEANGISNIQIWLRKLESLGRKKDNSQKYLAIAHAYDKAINSVKDN